VAHALLRAVSRLFSTPFDAKEKGASARVPTRHEECVRHLSYWMSPRRIANRTISVELCNPSFFMMRPRWASTV